MSSISISTFEIRQERTSRFYLRVEGTSAFKSFYFLFQLAAILDFSKEISQCRILSEICIMMFGI